MPTTREAIIEAATKSFLERGYESTSMDLVANEARVGRRTVYNQFESKKTLFDAILLSLWSKNQLEVTLESLSAADSPEQGLKEIGMAIANFWEPDVTVAFLRMTIAESTRYPELLQTFTSKGREPARRMVAQYLQRLHVAGYMNIPNVEFASSQFVYLIVGQDAWARMLGEPKVTRKQRVVIVTEAVTMFLARYRRQQP